MMKLKSPSISKTSKTVSIPCLLGLLIVASFFRPNPGYGKIYVDINQPSLHRINIAIPDFLNSSQQEQCQELSTALPAVLANDLDLSGYFMPMDKGAFLEENNEAFSIGDIRFRDWSVIGADLLVKVRYNCVGRSLDVEVRVYDVFLGRQIMKKRYLGKVSKHRQLMHRIGNEIIYLITGYKGMFLSRLAFVGTATGHKEIYVCDYDGHNVQMITSDKSIALFPEWSPKGDEIIYNSYKEDGAKLYLKDLRSGLVRKVSARKGLNTGGTWMSDGKRLALTLSYRGNADLYTIDLQGNILNRLVTHWGIDVSPTFSPDGEKIAFVSDRSGSPQIYVRDLVKETEERITFEGEYNTSPDWSVRNRIVFSQLKDNAMDIYTIDPDGGNLRRLSQDQGKNEDPCWSPDGRYLAFTSNRDGRYRLYLMNANGQNQRKITAFRGDQTSPSWSPF